jgi:hypothetical protein
MKVLPHFPGTVRKEEGLIFKIVFFLIAVVVIPAQGIPGDLNRDGKVDLTDFFILAENFGKEGLPEGDCNDDTQAQLPLVFEGEGTQITEAFTLEPGLRIVRVEFPQNSYLIVNLLDNNTGDHVKTLFNESSVKSEDIRILSQGFQIETAGTFRLNTTNISSPWKITIE